MLETTIVAIISLSLLLLVSKLFEDAFRKIGFPSFIGSILAGMLLGPGILNLITMEYLERLTIFFVIGINFLLFLAGAEEVGEIMSKRIEIKAIVLTIITFVLNVIALYLFAVLFGIISYETTIALGLIFGIIDMGPLVKGLIEARKLGTSEGMMITKIALLSEIFGIILFDFILVEHATAISILLSFLEMALFFVFVVLIGHYILVPFLKYIDLNFRASEATFAAIVSIVLLLSYVGELIGVPSPVVSLMVGSYLSGFLHSRPEQLERVKAFSMGFFEPLFFAGIGVFVTSLNPELILLATLLAIFFSIPKAAVGLFVTRGRLSLSMLSKGGISGALLLALLTEYKLIDEYTYSLFVISMIIMTILSAFAYHGIREEGEKEVRYPSIEDIIEPPEFVYCEERLSDVVELLVKYNEIIVVNNESKPMGLLTATDLVYLNPAHFSRIKVRDVMRTPPIIIHKNASFRALVELVYDTLADTIAVVDDDDKLVGIIKVRKVLSTILQKADLL